MLLPDPVVPPAVGVLLGVTMVVSPLEADSLPDLVRPPDLVTDPVVEAAVAAADRPVVALPVGVAPLVVGVVAVGAVVLPVPLLHEVTPVLPVAALAVAVVRVAAAAGLMVAMTLIHPLPPETDVRNLRPPPLMVRSWLPSARLTV